jgi:hypothetical protein
LLHLKISIETDQRQCHQDDPKLIQHDSINVSPELGDSRTRNP